MWHQLFLQFGEHKHEDKYVSSNVASNALLPQLIHAPRPASEKNNCFNTTNRHPNKIDPTRKKKWKNDVVFKYGLNNKEAYLSWQGYDKYGEKLSAIILQLSMPLIYFNACSTSQD